MNYDELSVQPGVYERRTGAPLSCSGGHGLWRGSWLSTARGTYVAEMDELGGAGLGRQPLDRQQALAIMHSDDEQLLALLDAAFFIRRQPFRSPGQVALLAECQERDVRRGLWATVPSPPSLQPAFRNIRCSTWKALLAGARQAVAANARTYCVATSGGTPDQRDAGSHCQRGGANQVRDEFTRMLLIGHADAEQAQRLKAAGVDRINHNLNTSRRFHGQICSTHSYEDRLRTLHAARDADLELCAG